jgi:hypothetical protein
MSLFINFSETPELYRMPGMHLGNQQRQDIIYQQNMPVATAQYHQQMPITNHQLYNPMTPIYHYPQENRQLPSQPQHQLHQVPNHAFTAPYNPPVVQSPVPNYMSPPPVHMPMPQESFAVPAALQHLIQWRALCSPSTQRR